MSHEHTPTTGENRFQSIIDIFEDPEQCRAILKALSELAIRAESDA